MLSQWMLPSWGGTNSTSSTTVKGDNTNRTAGGAGSSRSGINCTTTEDEVDEDKLADELLSQFPVYGSHSHQHQQDWLLMGYPVTTTTSTTMDAAATEQQQQQMDDERDGSGFMFFSSDHHSILTTGTSAGLIRQSPSMSTLGGASSIGGGGGGNADASSNAATTAASASSARGGRSGGGVADKQQQQKQQQQQNPLISPSTDDWDYEERFLWKTETLDDHKSKQKNSNDEAASNNNNSTNTTENTAAPLHTNYRQRHEWIYGNHKMENDQTTTATNVTMLTLPNPPRNNNSGIPPETTTTTPNSSSTSRRYFSTLRSPILSSSNNNNEQHQQQDDDRQHWMPDQLCKQCYSCETTFTVFRRRHHCRLCGQVFCNPCSAYFLPLPSSSHEQQQQAAIPTAAAAATAVASSIAASSASTNTSTTMIRVCRTCHEQVTQRGGLLLGSSSSLVKNNSIAVETAADSNNNNNTGPVTSSPRATVGKSINTSIHHSPFLLADFDSPETTATTRIASLRGGGGEMMGGGSGMDSVFLQSLSSKRRLVLLPELGISSSSSLLLQQQEQHQQQVQEMEFDSQRGQENCGDGRARITNHESAASLLASSTATAAAAAAAATATSSPTVAKTTGSAVSLSTSLQQQQQEPPLSKNNTKSDGNNSTINEAGTTSAAITATNNNKNELLSSSSSTAQAVREGNRHLGMTAASHLEHIASELLRQHAPLLWNSLSKKEEEKNKNNKHAGNSDDNNNNNTVDNNNKADNHSSASNTGNKEEEDHNDENDNKRGNDIEGDAMKSHWINQLLTLATRCCATVDPNVKNGDLLDIRPYCKVKVIPGGSYRDCAYMSGVLFRKTVSHKRMAKEIENPRIMLLSGGIEFTRNENRIASLETLFEQEGKYTEILVGKILKLKPDVLMAGRSVSRRAQELLLKAGVVLIQHVKSRLLSRISRQTGARIISGSDHVMSQFNASILGKCHRFRLATFRDNEVWVDQIIETTTAKSAEPDGTNQATGKRCVTYKRCIPTLLANPDLKNHERQAALAASKLGEGVLDGAEAVRSGLAKRGVAQTYVMLEGCPKNLGCTVVLRGADRAALKQVKTVLRFLIATAYNLRLETSYFKERGARIRPDFEVETKHTFSTSLCVDFGPPPAGRKIRPWNGSETAPESDPSDITAFDHQSILVTSVWMTDKSQCCPAEVKGICYYSMQDVALGQFLRDSCFNLSLKCQNPNCKKTVLDHSLSFVHNDGLINIVVEEMDEELPPSPNDPFGEDDDRTRKSEADDADGEIDKPIATWTYCRKCDKLVAPLAYISEKTWKFSFGKFLETFFYNRDAILNAPELGCSCQLQASAVVYFGCGKIAARFVYEPVRPFEVFVRRSLPIDISFHRSEARKRLEQISMASSTLFVKFDKHIERVTREARSLFNSAVNRPEHLQTVLSELNRIGSEVDHAAKTLQEKIASLSDECRRRDDEAVVEALLRFPWFARRYLFMLTSAWNEKLSATGVAITAMKKLASAVRGDGGLAPNVSVSNVVGDPYSDELLEGMKRLLVLNERYSTYNVTDINQALPALPGGSQHLPQEDFDDDFDEAETSIDFSDGVDADVLASRRRLQHTKPNLLQQDRKARIIPTKTLGAMRGIDSTRSSQETSPVSMAPKPTPGGAVKSAFNRLFNRGGREQDPYIVDLGIFADGRPRLEPGVKGIVLPVVDEQWSSVIAYSLASTEYAKQFKHFSKFHVSNMSNDPMLISSPTSMGSMDGSSLESTIFDPTSGQEWNESRTTERRMLFRNKTHIKHTFRDFDEKGHVTCKFVCTTYWATQFHAVRQIFLANNSTGIGEDADPLSSPGGVEQSYIESLSCAYSWAASGGKSGASFSRTLDDRFVIKCISRTELQMFLDCAPAYFEYLSKAFFHGLPTVLCKIVGVYQIGIHNRETGKRSMEQVAVMQNIFYNRKITKIFDLKGSLRGRFAANIQSAKDDSTQPDTPSMSDNSGGRRKEQWDHEQQQGGANNNNNSRNRDNTTPTTDHMSDESGGRGGTEHDSSTTDKQQQGGAGTLLDGDFLEFTQGRPVPLTDRAKAVFQMSILNDTLFLSIINVLDYSILVGIDEENMELVVGIIDFMRQYDILKQMERVGKSLPMVVGSEAPTIIQPPLYKSRFTNAMERYFMTVPSKWTQI